MRRSIVNLLVITLILMGCGDDITVPKPPTYLRMDLPDHDYERKITPCGFSMELPSFFSINDIAGNTNNGPCNLEVDMGPLNGTLYMFYYPLKSDDTLSRFINFSNDKVDDHKLKASAINDKRIIRKDKKVFGTFFELQGDVATNYQFYLTDSSQHFIRAEVLLNCRPNYDSLKPVLDYLKIDLEKIVQTLEWK
ncbi:MAG: hypothetical protein ACK45H_12980 [Bacteroidota bacterium]|jgi:gliding motility-associated lipoprotein GldD